MYVLHWYLIAIRYGRVPAQVSTFFDSCGQLWATGALVGKFVTMFTSAAGQHGGHEVGFFCVNLGVKLTSDHRSYHHTILRPP
jgi:multimeric flavodoxin WrbA